MAKESKHYRFRNVEFWAMGGRCYMLDLEKCADSSAHVLEQVKTLSPAELIKRAMAVRMGAGTRPDEVKEARDLLDHAVIVAKAAKFQGDPTDAKVLEHFSKHKRNNRVSMADSRLLLPAVGGNAPQKLQLGAPTDMLLNGVNVVPDFSIPSGTKLPKAAMESLRRRMRR